MTEELEVVEGPKKIEYSNEYCKYEFSAEELRDIAERLAIKTQELSQVESEKKSVVSSFKERMDRLALEIQEAARLYKDRYEMRNIECEVDRNFETGVISFIRTDTGLIERTKKMTMGERQKSIVDEAEKLDEIAQSSIQREMAAETSAL